MKRLLQGVAGLAAFALAAAGPGPNGPTPPAHAAGPSGSPAAHPHRAALVVDTGREVKRVCVRFSEDSISGAELLSRADVQPVFRQYSGKGAAVCALCGVGCPADESCLTCDPDGRYWAYHRAPAGSSRFTASGVGASNTMVRDGDVEGWRWGTGRAPPYASVAEVCDGALPATSTTTGATTTTSTSVTTATSTTSSGPTLGTATASAPADKGPSAPVTPEITTRPTEASRAAQSTADQPAASVASRSVEDDEGAGPWGLLAAVVVIAGLVTAGFRARRRRVPSG